MNTSVHGTQFSPRCTGTGVLQGQRNNDMGQTVTGETVMGKTVVVMCSLLDILEAIKLDVANIKIYCLQLAPVENAVDFEQEFLDKILVTAGKFDVFRSLLQRASQVIGSYRQWPNEQC